MYKTIAAVWYNKICTDKQLTPNHISIKIYGSNRQHRGCFIPQAETHSLVFLKMGEIMARNMLHRLELLINHYCYI